jgi:hypothetical protein
MKPYVLGEMNEELMRGMRRLRYSGQERKRDKALGQRTWCPDNCKHSSYKDKINSAIICFSK